MSKIKSDIEIARSAKMKPIKEVLDGINVPDKAEAYSPIGRYMAKIKSEYLENLKNKKDGKLILVTAITPTCLLYTSPSPRDGLLSRMPSSA